MNTIHKQNGQTPIEHIEGFGRTKLELLAAVARAGERGLGPDERKELIGPRAWNPWAGFITLGLIAHSRRGGEVFFSYITKRGLALLAHRGVEVTCTKD